MPSNPYIIGGVALAFLLVLGWGGYESMRASDAKHQLAAEVRRNEDLAAKVLAADEAVKAAAAINNRQALALDAQTRAVAAMRADDERQAESSRKALQIAAQTAQDARSRDQSRRAIAGLPPVEDMRAALRDAVGGL